MTTENTGIKTAEVLELKPKGKPGPKPKTEADSILALVKAELTAQDEKWGEQNHPLVGAQLPEAARAYYLKQADGWKNINDVRVADEVLGWDGILLEEVFEALSEGDTEAAITELVQVAAVAVQAILSLKRNAS